MNSIVRERAARRIYVAYMNIKYEYPRVVLAACCSPVPRTAEGRGHNVPVPCPGWHCPSPSRVTGWGHGYLQEGGRNQPFCAPRAMYPLANPDEPSAIGDVPHGDTEPPVGAVPGLQLPGGSRLKWGQGHPAGVGLPEGCPHVGQDPQPVAMSPWGHIA